MENVNNDGSEFSDKLTQHVKLQDNNAHLLRSSGLFWDKSKNNTVEWVVTLYRFNQSLSASKEQIRVDVSEKKPVYWEAEQQQAKNYSK